MLLYADISQQGTEQFPKENEYSEVRRCLILGAF